METVLYILHVIVCLGLLPVILLQSGKGGGVSAVFGGGASTVFGSRGASTFLTKVTAISAVIFMCTSMGLSWYSSRDRSVVADMPRQAAPAAIDPTPGEEAPADQAVPPGQQDAPAGEMTEEPVEGAEGP